MAMDHQQEPVKFNYVVLRLGRQCCCALRVRSMVEVWQQFTTMLSGVGSSLGSGCVWGGGGLGAACQPGIQGQRKPRHRSSSVMSMRQAKSDAGDKQGD